MLKVAALATVFSLAVSSSVLGAETRIERADPSVICHDEDMTLLVWRSQSTVLSIDYTRKTASLVVDGRRWLQLPQNIQTSIALSAFCRPAWLTHQLFWKFETRVAIFSVLPAVVSGIIG